MQKSAARVIQAFCLFCETATVLLIVGKNMNHGFALVGQLPIEGVQVTQNVHKRTPPFLTLAYSRLQSFFLLSQTQILLLKLEPFLIPLSLRRNIRFIQGYSVRVK